MTRFLLSREWTENVHRKPSGQSLAGKIWIGKTNLIYLFIFVIYIYLEKPKGSLKIAQGAKATQAGNYMDILGGAKFDEGGRQRDEVQNVDSLEIRALGLFLNSSFCRMMPTTSISTSGDPRALESDESTSIIVSSATFFFFFIMARGFLRVTLEPSSSW